MSRGRSRPARAEPRVVIDSTAFREAFARWPSGVAVIAVREDGRVLATTVTALLPLSPEPPTLLVSIGGTAQVQPYLTPGRAVGVSVLAESQGRVAMIFADAYPVGAPPFAAAGEPLVDGALVRLSCRVDRVEDAGDHTLVVLTIENAEAAPGGPLVRYERAYRKLAAD
jgi:flavin reductase (DIM6/NTAB) family NADH-FMN oxidoreductase RutF